MRGRGPRVGEALEHLGRLVDKSLITAEEERGEYRYRLLETIRHYARERLDEAAETARVEQLHRAFYLAVAEAANPEAGGERIFERAEIHLDNLPGGARLRALRRPPGRASHRGGAVATLDAARVLRGGLSVARRGARG